MRLTAPLVVSLAALLLPSAVAVKQFPRPKVKGVSNPRELNAYSKRQYRVKRSVTDVCMSTTGEGFGNAMGVPGAAAYAGVDVCLCSQEIDSWIATNPNGVALGHALGASDVKSALQLLFSPSSGESLVESCTTPANAVRTCGGGDGGGTVCRFACDNGYSEDGDSCVCEEPNTECNGVCGDFSEGCGSARPVGILRKRRSLPITTLAQAKVNCKIYESVCGIIGRENTQDYECVDTSSALDSCGGCITPHPFYEPYRVSSKGVDCGLLPGVIGARCQNSQCVISRCKKGLEPSADGTECVPVAFMTERILVDGVLPIFKLSHRRQNAVTSVVPKVELVAQVKGLVTAVGELDAIVSVLPVQDANAAVNVTASVKVTVDAATTIVKSTTVSGAVANIKAFGDAISEFKASLDGCDCVKALGLEEVLVKLDGASEHSLNLQGWLDVNALAQPELPEISIPGLPTIAIPNTSDLPIDLGLSALLDTVIGSVNAEATTKVSISEQVSPLAHAVLQLKAVSSNFHGPSFFSSFSGGPSFFALSGNTRLDATISDPIVQATIDFVGSVDSVTALSNLNTLVAANAALSNTLGSIPNPTSELTGLLSILDTVGQLTLELMKSLSLESTLDGVLPLGLSKILGSLVGSLTTTPGTLMKDLQDKIGELVGVVLGLQSQLPRIPGLLPSASGVPGIPTPGLPGGDLLGLIVRTVKQLLGSLGVGDLLKSLEALIWATETLETALGGCGCVDALGLQGAYKGAGKVKVKALELKTFVEASKDALVSSISGSESGSVVANADVLVEALNILS
ncbi:hypothetical protein DXG03_005526 [Asterophora parasitica]|uniref:Protein CPL1-like domain-containing protein n=1 Tax=Asterophora parasitica TaxID=117018 RepID=A0A9P7KCL2_9AGAR|nr:hypothetical protein DXG03_005526 [Asterophora parasitica]